MKTYPQVTLLSEQQPGVRPGAGGRFSGIHPLSQPDVYAAMYDLARAFGLPDLLPSNIVRGWQNRNVLPPETNEYAVITVMQAQRRGTNVTHFAFDPTTQNDGTLTTAELVQCAVQFDFCADNDTARQRAQSLELVSRSPLAADFLAPHGIAPLYAEDVRDLSFVDGSDQFVQRFTVTLHVSFWASMAASVGWFDHVNLYVENVDVHHPPVPAHTDFRGSESRESALSLSPPTGGPTGISPATVRADSCGNESRKAAPSLNPPTGGPTGSKE